VRGVVFSMIKGVYSRIQFLEKKENLENTKEAVAKFEGRLNVEIRR